MFGSSLSPSKCAVALGKHQAILDVLYVTAMPVPAVLLIPKTWRRNFRHTYITVDNVAISQPGTRLDQGPREIIFQDH